MANDQFHRKPGLKLEGEFTIIIGNGVPFLIENGGFSLLLFWFERPIIPMQHGLLRHGLEG
ncbi:MAG: hypothetical protein U5K79_19305 [Cyclobacteriaceae bacterium]|nr:hypothetical protein [Cyclobacteriaceae bacterium]